MLGHFHELSTLYTKLTENIHLVDLREFISNSSHCPGEFIPFKNISKTSICRKVCFLFVQYCVQFRRHSQEANESLRPAIGLSKFSFLSTKTLCDICERFEYVTHDILYD